MCQINNLQVALLCASQSGHNMSLMAFYTDNQNLAEWPLETADNMSVCECLCESVCICVSVCVHKCICACM